MPGPVSRYFRVRNFEKFQHYKDRVPVWIKLHLSVLNDFEFSVLPDAAKWHLVGIWALAARRGNRLPLEAHWLAGQIGANAPVDLNLLLASGFIIEIDPASNLLAEPEQVASPERASLEEESETEEERDSEGGGVDARARECNNGASPDPAFWPRPIPDLPDKQPAEDAVMRDYIAEACAAIGVHSTNREQQPTHPQMIDVWMKAGADFDLDILPTLRLVMATRSTPPHSWKYFTNAVMDAKATRETPIQPGTPQNGKHRGRVRQNNSDVINAAFAKHYAASRKPDPD